MADTTLVFDPTAPSQNERRRLTHTLDSLSGKVVGFIDNSKPNFDHLVEDLAELLISRYGVSAVIKCRKRLSSQPAPEAVIQELSEQCDAVITGSGD